MNVLELFAGSRSIGKVAEERGHNVFSTDIQPFEKIDHVGDILQMDLGIIPFVPDMVWASPPCTSYSVASMGKHWGGGKKAYIPKTEEAKLGIALALRAIEIIEHFKKLNPNLVWYMENPRGVLRHMPFMKTLPIRNTIMYCKYGDARMKPTDIWTNNSIWVPRPMCKNNGHGLTTFNGQTWALDAIGRPCHLSAPRGAKTGTQGLKGDYERSKLPPEMCLEVVEAAERFVTTFKEKSLHWSNQDSDPS